MLQVRINKFNIYFHYPLFAFWCKNFLTISKLLIIRQISLIFYFTDSIDRHYLFNFFLVDQFNDNLIGGSKTQNSLFINTKQKPTYVLKTVAFNTPEKNLNYGNSAVQYSLNSQQIVLILNYTLKQTKNIFLRKVQFRKLLKLQLYTNFNKNVCTFSL